MTQTGKPVVFGNEHVLQSTEYACVRDVEVAMELFRGELPAGGEHLAVCPDHAIDEITERLLRGLHRRIIRKARSSSGCCQVIDQPEGILNVAAWKLRLVLHNRAALLDQPARGLFHVRDRYLEHRS